MHPEIGLLLCIVNLPLLITLMRESIGFALLLLIAVGGVRSCMKPKAAPGYSNQQLLQSCVSKAKYAFGRSGKDDSFCYDRYGND